MVDLRFEWWICERCSKHILTQTLKEVFEHRDRTGHARFIPLNIHPSESNEETATASNISPSLTELASVQFGK